MATTIESPPMDARDVIQALALETPDSPTKKKRPSFRLFKGAKSTSQIHNTTNDVDAAADPTSPIKSPSTKKRTSLKKRMGGLVKRMSSIRRNNKGKNSSDPTDPALNETFDTAEGDSPTTSSDKLSQDEDKVRCNVDDALRLLGELVRIKKPTYIIGFDIFVCSPIPFLAGCR